MKEEGRKQEPITLENYLAMKKAVKMLGRALNVEVKNCAGCGKGREEGLGPCRLCRPAKNVLTQARLILKPIYGVKEFN